MYQNALHCIEYLFSFPVNRLNHRKIEHVEYSRYTGRQIEYTVNRL